MKINQLFTKRVEVELLLKVLECFAVKSLDDRRTFCKYDMVQNETVSKLTDLIPELEQYYIPCKARIYLRNMTEKKAITVLKQILRLHGYCLNSYERNVCHRKIIFYRLISEQEKQTKYQMKYYNVTNILTFN
jgi:hypothetical protein